VIVPLLNEARIVPSLLAEARRWPVEELIFVDGGSHDDTPALLAAAGVRWLTSAPGRGVQLNAGARATRAEVLLFVHADTRLKPRHVHAVRRVMASADIVGGRFDVRLSGAQPAFRLIEFMINLRSRLSRISTGDQAMFVRRDVFESLGGFADWPLMEDVEFSRRLKRVGRIACLRPPVVTSSRRWERHGIARTVALMWWLRLLFWLGVSPVKLARIYRHAR